MTFKPQPGSLYLAFMFLTVLWGAPSLAAQEPELDMGQLLEQVRQGRAGDAEANRQRMAEFKQNQAQQQELLEALLQEQAKEEQRSDELEAQFEANELLIADLEERMAERLGSLKELFGVLQQVASDAQAQFANSLTQIENPQRTDYLLEFAGKMGQTTDLPTIEEIEKLWYQLQWEMTESGRVARLQHPVITSDGEEQEQALIRIGNFNLIADGRYFQFIPETTRVVEFGRQPGRRYMDGARNIGAADGFEAVTLDPTRGQLMGLLVQAPDLRERIAQGGVIGYLIIGLGVLAAIVALYRLVALLLAERAIGKQLGQLDQPGNNPLGRVLQVYRSNEQWDPETLELKLGEAILRELPSINRGLAFLKIVAAVAPLMGLLGTVTGMIITFQAITLFGAGDPKLMAGGISQALVTTVLGLTVAIPTLLLHQLVQTRARRISEVLEQEAVALTALEAER